MENKGMEEEIKKAYLSWGDKGMSDVNETSIFQTFYNTDEALVECENQLNKVGLGTGYVSNSSKLDQLIENRSILYSYIDALLEYVETKIDSPLCENFRLNATEKISRIRLEDFSVENTKGITVLLFSDSPVYRGSKYIRKTRAG